jgi:hypothetical protein
MPLGRYCATTISHRATFFVTDRPGKMKGNWGRRYYAAKGRIPSSSNRHSMCLPMRVTTSSRASSFNGSA